MNTNQIGNLGEAKVLCKCLQLGYDVFLPYGDGNRVDLILKKGDKLYKVQIKTSATASNGTVIFHLASAKATRQKETEVHLYTKKKQIFIFCIVLLEIKFIFFKQKKLQRDR